MSAMLITLLTLMVGGVVLAPAAQACPSWCQQYQYHADGGRGEYCSATGETKPLSWAGAYSSVVEYPKAGAEGACQYPSYEAAYNAAKAEADAIVKINKDKATKDYTEGACKPKLYSCEYTEATVPGGTAEYCRVDGQKATVTWEGATAHNTYGPFEDPEGKPLDQVRCDFTADGQELAQAASQADAEELAAQNRTDAYAEITVGVCSAGQTYAATGSAGGSVDYCTTTGATAVVTYTGAGSATSTVSQADANFVAQQKADAAAQADLAAKTPTGATLGACGVPQVTPAPVTQVEAATVAAPAPATVTVPAAATLPATVPAGDGSTVPQSAVWMLAVLTLASVGVVASAIRLATRRTS